MKRRWTRTASALLAALLLIPAVPQSVQSLEYQGTKSYQSGKYYRALQQVQLTGDPRTDLVNVALSQVGYQESTYGADLSGEIYGNLNYTEYGNWYGQQDQWCAVFVSWCAAMAGISKDIVPKHAYTPNGLYWLKDQWKRAYSRSKVEAGVYTPQPGDIIYFKSPNTTASTNHVGIVTDYRDGVVYTVEGNTLVPGAFSSGGMVAQNAYAITNKYIVYICSPDYEKAEQTLENAIAQRTPAEKQTALRQALCVLESGVEESYGRIGQTPDGRLTVGCAQWYGNDAKALLQTVRAADPEVFARLDTAGIRAELDRDWTDNCLSPEKIACLQEILTSDAGIQAQNAALDQMLRKGQAEAAEQGVADEDAQLACAVLRCVGGTAAVRRVLRIAENNSLQAICTGMDRLGYPGSSLIYEALQ